MRSVPVDAGENDGVSEDRCQSEKKKAIMLKIKNAIHRLWGNVNLRFFRSRRGSVLILVVVLLVLMALMGTAFLVTTRTDLASSKLYQRNVQIDLLVQGVENMSLAAMTDLLL